MKRLVWIFLIFILFFFPSPSLASDINTTDKLITVDLHKRMLFVWDGGKIINQSKVSIGLPKTPTVTGSFKIRRKIPSQTMKGESKFYGKYLYKNVPNIMYFYQGYAIHGSYWIKYFGTQASHGCVNVPLDFAKWLYDWAPVGTRVEIF